MAGALTCRSSRLDWCEQLRREQQSHLSPAHMIQTVREGNSGSLYLTNRRAEELFIPNYDMDAAIELLREFQALKQNDGCPLKASCRVGFYNWYPSMVSYLFWYVFFPFIKYQPLVSEYLKGQREFRWDNRGTFRIFMD